MAGNQGKANRDRAAAPFLRLLDETGWLVMGEYVNGSTPLDVICPNGHVTTVVRQYFVNTCRVCRPSASSAPGVYDDYGRVTDMAPSVRRSSHKPYGF